LIKAALKTVGLLLGFLFFLCITISSKPIFNHIYGLISPATSYVQNATEDFFSRSVSGTRTYSKKLFDNSVPKLRDSVGSKLSSNLKKVNEPEEKITHEEKAELDQLIKNH
jgi:hypothetical protein